MFTYLAEVHERCIEGKTLKVTNLIPEFRSDERIAVKKQIERQLYDIFCKYVKDKS